MKQRVAMIGDWIKDESSIAELSRIYGVSRVTIYKWLERFEAEGPAGIRERSRAPHRHPNAVPEEISYSSCKTKSSYLGAEEDTEVITGSIPE